MSRGYGYTGGQNRRANGRATSERGTPRAADLNAPGPPTDQGRYREEHTGIGLPFRGILDALWHVDTPCSTGEAGALRGMSRHRCPCWSIYAIIKTHGRLPDVYVLLDADGGPRYSLDTRDGMQFPQFVCEIASERTWRRDMGVKQRLYADLGVREYVVFDPTGALLGTMVRAWRRAADGRWQRWQPDSDGYLESQMLGLRFTSPRRRCCTVMIRC